MNFKFKYIICILTVFLFWACEKDNITPPKSTFTGAILYKGDTIQGAFSQINFELWQPGFGKLTPINVNVATNGSFSALLFNGDYQLDFPSNQLPFLTSNLDPIGGSDTLPIHVNGDLSMNLNVIPYYMIRDPKFSMADSIVTATCQLEKIITDANARNIQSVTLYVNKTYFVDNNQNIVTKSIGGAAITDMNNIQLAAKIPVLTPDQNYVFARIGIKIANVGALLFSPIIRIDIQ